MTKTVEILKDEDLQLQEGVNTFVFLSLAVDTEAPTPTAKTEALEDNINDSIILVSKYLLQKE